MDRAEFVHLYEGQRSGFKSGKTLKSTFLKARMDVLEQVLSFVSCLLSNTSCQNLQYFYSSPNPGFTHSLPTQQLFYPEREYDLPSQFYHQREQFARSQFKTSGAHIQPAPPLFFESFPQYRIPGAHVQPPPPTSYQSPPQYRVPGAHVQPPPPTFYQSTPQYRVPGAHVQPPPPSFYQSTMNTQPADDNYRGFSYHINYNDGAKSSVVFFRGGVDYNITTPPKITVASDSVDPQHANNIQRNIQKALDNQNLPQILTHPNAHQTLQSTISAILSEPFEDSGIVHFYEGLLPTLPASTISLDSSTPNPNSNRNQLPETNETSSQKESTNDEDSVSIVAASRLRNAKNLDLNSTVVGEKETPIADVATTEEASTEESIGISSITTVPTVSFSEQPRSDDIETFDITTIASENVNSTTTSTDASSSSTTTTFATTMNAEASTTEGKRESR